ncbi:alkaline phosphatase family protein [Cytophagaceae bacterium ABcell3]|nr:alkaline phosphatase family protein [Cytophagaceae bacterium ABcell3]
MRKLAVLNIVGLSNSIIGKNTPFIKSRIEQGALSYIKPAFPAVTCSAQTTYLTGKSPDEHGIVGNGWYFKDECEIKFWKQSDKLVKTPRIWDVVRKEHPEFTCANLFWWYNMYSSADFSATPRPQYPADGRKIPDIYTQPAGLRDKLQKALGTFPLFNFWGPKAGIKSSRWIAESAIYVDRLYKSDLSLVYLPHLDYCLQKFGPDEENISKELKEIDDLVQYLTTYFEQHGTDVLILSEYGISPVDRPVAINRVLREKGLITVREEQGRELLDAGASKAFAVADHQVAHVYVNDNSVKDEVKQLLANIEGVGDVLAGDERMKYNCIHDRAGDFIVVADSRSWFTYYYWLDDDHAPDFARTVDIHRKPGYDPVEMFIDPDLKFPTLEVASKLAKKKMGFRSLMDVIPLKPELVKGSHGRIPEDQKYYPVVISSQKEHLSEKMVSAESIFDIILKHLQ